MPRFPEGTHFIVQLPGGEIVSSAEDPARAHALAAGDIDPGRARDFDRQTWAKAVNVFFRLFETLRILARQEAREEERTLSAWENEGGAF